MISKNVSAAPIHTPVPLRCQIRATLLKRAGLTDGGQPPRMASSHTGSRAAGMIQAALTHGTHIHSAKEAPCFTHNRTRSATCSTSRESGISRPIRATPARRNDGIWACRPPAPSPFPAVGTSSTPICTTISVRPGMCANFTCPRWRGQRIFVRVGLANYAAEMWINGQKVGGHWAATCPSNATSPIPSRGTARTRWRSAWRTSSSPHACPPATCRPRAAA